MPPFIDYRNPAVISIGQSPLHLEVVVVELLPNFEYPSVTSTRTLNRVITTTTNEAQPIQGWAF
jgi:hypothetical protein